MTCSIFLVLHPSFFTCRRAGARTSHAAEGRGKATLFVHALVRASMQTISVDSPAFFGGGHLCEATALECMLLWALRFA